mmetsp:Transcript_22399/g.42054  ORF Transcript_22399/g.42054 Transcript_22399/m.42054 type:complete len:167 (-) Transcript_22399:200-700(-)
MLKTHLVFASLFMTGSLIQQWMLAWCAMDARRRRVHKMLGYVVVTCAIISSSSSILMSNKALHGAGAFFGPWSVLWLIAATATLFYALRREFKAHKLWADLLTQSATLFISGRCVILACSITKCVPEPNAYYYAIGGSLLLALLKFGTDILAMRKHMKLLARRHYL